MKYILNESKIKTTNGFKMNNINVDLEIPTNLEFHDFDVYNDNEKIIINSEIKNKKINSNIGLELQKYLNLEINVLKNSINKNITKLVYEFNNNNLIDKINIKLEENSNSDIVIVFKSINEKSSFHHLFLNIEGLENSKSNITIVNMLNSNSIFLNAITENISSSSEVKLNLIDLNGKLRITNIDTSCLEYNSKSYINNI